MDFSKKLEFNKANLAALQCNEVFQSYRMSGKVHCQLSSNGLAGFVAPFDGYAFNLASSNKELASSFLNWAEENPRDWDKNLYAVFGSCRNSNAPTETKSLTPLLLQSLYLCCDPP